MIRGATTAAGEIRREVIEAEEIVFKDGKIKTTRHRAIVREDSDLLVYDILLVEGLGRYTEDGVWVGKGGWRGAGRVVSTVWPSFRDTVGHYGWLRERPGGWWGRGSTFDTQHDAQCWLDETATAGQFVRLRAVLDDQGRPVQEKWAIRIGNGYLTIE